MKAFVRWLVHAGRLTGALLVAACQSQGEGERCDPLNGAADCASGLVCGTANVCCVQGSSACNAPSGVAGSGGSSVGDGAVPSSVDADATAAQDATDASVAAPDVGSDAAASAPETGSADGSAAQGDGADDPGKSPTGDGAAE